MPKSLHRLLLAVLLLAAGSALAQSDPPSRVGRLSYLDGEVGFKVDRNDQGGPATLNWPVSSGAVLDSGRQGRAEVWIGSTAYRISRDSEVEFPVVDDRRVDVRVSGGSLAVTVLDRDQADDVEVMTPDGNIRFLTPGRYRVNVHAERSELVVQAGRATFDNGRRTVPVAAGQMAVLSSDGGERLEAARAYDGFDQWVAQRENATLADTARRHVSPHMTGYQDLDAYGDWRTTGDYGTVWYPRGLSSDWAPYRQGRWAWVAPWGWTWIDEAPWGFAPFHYGRWAFIAGRWGWVPGRLVARPVYAPALVGWVGNPGWSASFSFGSAPAVGWFPLAPREVYVPAYRYSPTYVRQVNITHVTNVTQIERVVRGAPPAYSHHALPQAVTVVPTRQMQEGRPISASEVRRHERRDLDRAPLARQAPSTQWVAPAPAAARPHDGPRAAGREFEAQRMPGAERGTFREAGRGDRPRGSEGGPPADGRTRQAVESASPSPRQETPFPGAGRGAPEGGRNPFGEARRESGRSSGEGAPGMGTARQQDSAAPVQQGRPAATESAGDARREFFRRQQEARQDNPGGLPDARRDERSPSASPPQRREQRGEWPRQAQPPGSPPAAAQPQPARPPEGASAPVRREMPASDMRREERQPPAFPQQDREQRREMREMQRQERPSQPAAGSAAPREAISAPPSFRREMPPPDMPRDMPRMERPMPAQPAPQAMPPREQPRPAPEVRMPPPQPAAPPPPRAEPPRQQPAAQGGNEAHRRRDEERGQR
ncbi:DUF6600 domain-containing protein [uncultured Dechloromonas sp.]|uniref:DUF6600 domain-containing protein n=1 Tax=uncultured Dechloromonas sp. TaxID=171719 RepID=UPI0025D42B65|nr:DUF6600 domain-containing protein [uncultured Dechloromonas sp.]